MYVLRTTARDWKGLGDITIDWVNHNNLIGPNEAGKTAILESIIDSMSKIDSRQLPQPINNRRGATTAEYEHEFTVDGETVVLKISRMYRANGKNSLTIEPSPPMNPITKKAYTNSDFLNLLYPNASKLDVAELKKRTSGEWASDVLDMMGIEHLLKELDDKDTRLRKQRYDIGRDRDKAVANVPDRRPEKVEAVDTDKINEKLTIARNQKEQFDHHQYQWDQAQDSISKKEALIAQLQKEIRQLEADAEDHYAKIEEFDGAEEAVAKLEHQLSNAAEINTQAKAYEAYDDLVLVADQCIDKYAALDDQVKAIPAQKAKLFTDNDCPVEGITMTINPDDPDDKGTLCYKDVPIQQINEGARMLLGAQIMLNKLSNQTVTMDDGTQIDSLKLLMVENGSQADTNTRAAIRELCDAVGVQTIFELVIGERWDDEQQCLVPDYDTADKIGIVIEEGEIHSK
jgi:hypothetical protein